jgi:sodium-dependent dicarboxylate transporter 2/3/5
VARAAHADTPGVTSAPNGAPAERVRTGAAAGCALAAAVAWFVPWGLDPAAHATLVVLVAVGGLWLTEAVPLGVTALVVSVLGVLLGAVPARDAFSGFADSTVFLFLGTFLLADAVSQHGLDRRLTDTVLARPRIRNRPRLLLWAVGLVACLASAWISNTATTAILLPVALTAGRFGSPRFGAATLLALAYAASLGGLATKIGTPPNLIGIGALEQATGTQVSFVQWTILLGPLALGFTVLVLAWLTLLGGKVPRVAPGVEGGPRRPWSRAERTVLATFAGVVVCWIVPGALASIPSLQDVAWVAALKTRLPEASVPLAGAALLFVLPAERAGPRVLTSAALRRLDWNTLLLFGGGLTLGAMMQSSGLARTLGAGLFEGMPAGGTFFIALAAALMAIVVSEFTSNTASAALVVPIVIELARAGNVDPVAPALAATVACSFGFMLPVSTPPNALVFGTGKLSIGLMVRCGILLDIAGAIAVAAWVTLVT